MTAGLACYLRVSTEDQKRDETIKVQRDAFEKTNPGAPLYEDDGVTSDIPFDQRPGGRAMFQAIKDGKIKRVTLWRADRLGRGMTGIVAASLIENAGAVVESLTEGILSLKDEGRILYTFVTFGLGGAEKVAIRQRTMAGSARLAKEGVWLGGIVPYGYRKVGEKKSSRLEVSTDPLPGHTLSEAQVIKQIFQMAARGESTCKIARHLNDIAVPPRYRIDDREVLRGKRKQRTSGLWMPGRVRNLIINKTYMGVHEYGKRTTSRGADFRKKYKANPKDKWIVRACPAIVDKDLWQRANDAMHKNQNFAMAHAKNSYLLRGLIHCGICNLTFIGSKTSGTTKFYYKCGGKHSMRGPYFMEHGKRCPSPTLRGQDLEDAVWGDVAIFLFRPGLVLNELHQKVLENDRTGNGGQEVIADLERALARHEAARRRVLDKFAYNEHVGEAEFHRMLGEIEVRRTETEQQLAAARKIAADKGARVRMLQTARDLLDKLQTGAQGKLSFAKRRQIVEALVERITVTPTQTGRPEVKVTYLFEEHLDRYRQWASAQDDDDGPCGQASQYSGMDSWPRSA